jgi:hypothetical protein
LNFVSTSTYLFCNLKNVRILAGDLAQAIEYLPSKWVALSSNPSTAKKKKSRILFDRVVANVCLLDGWQVDGWMGGWASGQMGG